MTRLQRLRLLALAAVGMGYGVGFPPRFDEDALAAWVDRAALWLRERDEDAFAEAWFAAYGEERVSDPASDERASVLMPCVETEQAQ